MNAMKMGEIRGEFEAGLIEKADYIDRMHRVHRQLFEYADRLQQVGLSSLTITAGEVIATVRDSGLQLICNPEDARLAPIEILNFGAYEPQELQVVLGLFSGGGVLLDIGANCGWYALNCAKALPGLRVHAFEPLPQSFAQLQRNLTLNPGLAVTTHRLGLSDRPGELKFYYYPEGSGNASLANLSERSSVVEVLCPVTTVDDFATSQRVTVDYIKCDVEGAELLVFKGALSVIRRDRPIVFSEMLRKWSRRFDYHPNDIIDLFAAEGYEVFVANGAGLTPFGRMDESTQETNFFFLHKEQHADVRQRMLAADRRAEP